MPDVIVTRIGHGTNARFRVMLNPDVMPRLRVHDIYAGALKQHKGEGSQALSQRLQEARWFIKNIQQRFDTILRVSNAIVERQKSYFVHGELAMRPLVLREIADELGLHESTISRVTTAKYMATPYGTVELKYFFGSALGTETGGNASSTAVRALIKQFVSAEDVKKPLSDSQVSEMLKEQGIECARRTVAKYREALRIAPANLRKALVAMSAPPRPVAAVVAPGLGLDGGAAARQRLRDAAGRVRAHAVQGDAAVHRHRARPHRQGLAARPRPERLPAHAQRRLRAQHAARTRAPRRAHARRAVLPDRQRRDRPLPAAHAARRGAARRARAAPDGRPLHRRARTSCCSALAATPNLELRLFNPFPAGRGSMLRRFSASLFDFSRVNRRMHNKLFIADGAMAVAGGRNIGNQYFTQTAGANFIDLDTFVAGALIPRLAQPVRPVLEQRVRAADRGRGRAPRCRARNCQRRFEELTGPATTPPPRPPAPNDLLGYSPIVRGPQRRPARPDLDHRRGLCRFARPRDRQAGRPTAACRCSTSTACATT